MAAALFLLYSGFRFLFGEDINAKKDGKSSKATYYKHIHTLFSLYKLSKSEKEIMCNLSLLF